jgi:hypothetical protein
MKTISVITLSDFHCTYDYYNTLPVCVKILGNVAVNLHKNTLLGI